jgi:hypothetical protein
MRHWQGRLNSEAPVLLHMTDQRDCPCQDFQRCRNVRKHMRAVRCWMAAIATRAELDTCAKSLGLRSVLGVDGRRP